MVKKVGDEAIADGIERLDRAPAFRDLLQQLSPDGKLLSYYAATLTEADIEDLVRNTEGKHFELTEVDGQVQLALVEGEGEPVVERVSLSTGYGSLGAMPLKRLPRYGYDCWQAYVAAYAFALGTGMVCWPAGLWALACSAGSSVLFPINWNDACR
ncbi:hypothetical protein [Arachnia propionica]|uniref:Uncharacterized protein n=1 Tax=Arachnia propionica TaxID=1750 RepID=A0A3P1WU30_9ACTN|nr:hypothetical protein [Arachnia propionica]RRD50064.1 hypothetical protein EII35_05755 [Arachnia propionica]